MVLVTAWQDTVVENFDLSAAGSPLRAANLNHLNITDHPVVQALALGRILEAVD